MTMEWYWWALMGYVVFLALFLRVWSGLGEINKSYDEWTP